MFVYISVIVILEEAQTSLQIIRKINLRSAGYHTEYHEMKGEAMTSFMLLTHVHSNWA